MIKNFARYESNIENRVGHFFVDGDCPIEIAEKMALDFLQYLGIVKQNIINHQKAQEAQEAQEAQPVQNEESKIEELSNVG